MNKLIMIFGIAVILIGCTKEEKKATPESSLLVEKSEIKITDPSVLYENEGLMLIEKINCISCHKTEGKLVGPSFQEIADRYTTADINILATKIIEGGKGNWGEVPMSPHSGMSRENAVKMVEYIITLKK